MMFDGTKLLAALMSTAQLCKSHAHISFQSKFVEFLYVATQREAKYSTQLLCRLDKLVMNAI